MRKKLENVQKVWHTGMAKVEKEVKTKSSSFLNALVMGMLVETQI
jgi:hypothetical protein